MNVKKVIGSVLLAATVFSFSNPPVYAATTDIKDYPRVAVMNFGNKAITSRGLRNHDFSSATEYAIYQLSACGWFDLIDYEQLGTIANMHNINMSGLIDQGTAVQIGKIAGAQFMVVGNLTGLTTKETEFAYQHGSKGSIGNAQHAVTANVALRIVDIETGRIVVAGIGKGSSTSTHTELHFKKYRNRKIETEDISDSINRDIIDEYTKNTSSNTISKSSKNEDTITTSNTTDTTNKINYEEKYDNSKIEKEKITENTNSLRENNSTSKESNTNDSINQTIIKEMGKSSKGDVNGDGIIDKIDLEVLEAFIAELPIDDNFVYENANINGDDSIDIIDVSILKKYLVGQGMLPNEVIENQEDIISKESATTNYENKEVEKTSSDFESVKDTSSVENGSKSTVTTETSSTNSKGSESTNSIAVSNESTNSIEEGITKADNVSTQRTSNKSIYYERETEDYAVRIGTVEVSDIQVRNAISKAVRDAIYGRTGIMTTLNNGKTLKIKTGF